MSYLTYSVVHRRVWNAEEPVPTQPSHTLSCQFSISASSSILSPAFSCFNSILSPPLGGPQGKGVCSCSRRLCSPLLFLFPFPAIPVFFPGS